MSRIGVSAFLLLSLCLCFLPSTHSAPTINWDFPTNGYIWERGTTNTLRWTVFDNPPTDVVLNYSNIRLYNTYGTTSQRGVISFTAANQPVNVGGSVSVSYTMGNQTSIDGTSCHFVLAYYDNSGAGGTAVLQTEDLSSLWYFKIQAQALTIYFNNPPTGGTKVTYIRGTTIPISFSITQGRAFTCDIALMDYSTFQYNIITGLNINPTGPTVYNWYVPDNIVVKSSWNFRVTIQTAEPFHNVPYTDTSDYFYTDYASADVIITSPISSSVWQTGTTHTVQWVCTGPIYSIQLDLVTSSSGTSLSLITSNVDCSLGKFNWQVPAGFAVSSSYYYIRATAVNQSVTVGSPVVSLSNSFDLSTTTNTLEQFDVEPVYDPTKCNKCISDGLNGDNFCACARLCGRLCLPGYKDAFSGYDPVSLQTRRYIFDVNFTGNVVDVPTVGIFFVPLNLDVVPEPVDIQAVSTSIVSDLTSFQKLLSFGVEVGGETNGVEGTGGVDYSSMKSKLQGRSVRAGYKEFNRFIFKTTPLDTNPATVKLNSLFLADVATLPITFSPSTYAAFIDKFGPYFFDYCKFGVSATITSLVDECVFQTINSEQVGVGLDVSAASTGVTGSASFSQSEEDNKNCLAGKSEATMKLLGGDFNKFACYYDASQAEFLCNGTWNTYAATAKYNPYRLEYKLSRISTLVADPTIRANIDTAITTYLLNANTSITNVLPKPWTGGACPCAPPQTTQATPEPPPPPSTSLIIGIVVGGIFLVIIIAAVVKQYLCGAHGEGGGGASGYGA